jgi:hypothetical protein
MNAWRDPRVDVAIQGFQELLNLADRRLRRYAYVVEIQTTRLDSPVVWPPKARMSGMPYRLTTPGARGQVDGCAGGDARHVAGRVAAGCDKTCLRSVGGARYVAGPGRVAAVVPELGD